MSDYIFNLYVDDELIDEAARQGSRVSLLSLSRMLDGTAGSMNFMAQSADPVPAFADGSRVRVSLDDGSGGGAVAAFGGRIMSISTHDDEHNGPFVHEYRCNSYEYLMDQVSVWNPTVPGREIVFNSKEGRDDDYDPDMSGYTVGEILIYLMDSHADRMAVAGVIGYVSGDLDALTLIPTDRVTFGGNRLWSQMVDFVRDWTGRFWPYIEPVGGLTPGGRVRVLDSRSMTPTELAIDGRTVPMPSLDRHLEDVTTRLTIVGGPIIKAAMLQESRGELAINGTTPEKEAWVYNDYANPRNALDFGTITAQTATTITYESDKPDSFFDADFLPSRKFQAYLTNTVGAGIEEHDQRAVISNTAMAPGGSCVITLAYPLSVGGWDTCRLVGRPGGLSKIWTEYNIVNEYIASHLVLRGNIEAQFVTKYSAVNTMAPMGAVEWGAGAVGEGVIQNLEFEVKTVAGRIRFKQPTVSLFNTPDDMADGWTHYDAPKEVYALVFYAAGVNRATFPPDDVTDPEDPIPVHAGDAFTRLGYMNDDLIYMPEWVDPAEGPAMLALAEARHETMCDEIIQGSVIVNALYLAALAGIALDMPGDDWTSGLESAGLIVRGVAYQFRGAGADEVISSLQVSNQRMPAKGFRTFVHESYSSIVSDPYGQGNFRLGTAEFGGGKAGSIGELLVMAMTGRISADDLAGSGLFDAGSMPPPRADFTHAGNGQPPPPPVDPFGLGEGMP